MVMANQRVYPLAHSTWSLRYFAANGDVLDFGDSSRFIPIQRHGFGNPSVQAAVSRGVMQQGDTPTQVYYQPRQLEVPTWLMPRAEPMNVLRLRCADAMDATLGMGTVEFNDLQTKRLWTCRVLPDAFPMDTEPQKALGQQTTFRWVAHDPRWYGTPQEYHLLPDGGTVTVMNSGSQEAQWVLTAAGPLTNPRFENVTTGKVIVVAGYVTEDEALQISSVFNQKACIAFSNGVYPVVSRRLYPDRTQGSEYWQLARGENAIRLLSSPVRSDPYPEAKLRFSPAVMGV